jgi:putative hemolysin
LVLVSGVWPQVVLVGVLVLLNAAFAGSEMALVSLREGQLQRLEQRSETGAVLARLAREPNRFLATIQIGITLAGFLASAAAAVSLAEPLKDPLAFLGGAAEPIAIVLVTLVLAYATLVFGELAPKRIAMQRAERWGLFAARPLAAMATFTRPAVWLLSRSTDLAVRLVGADPSRQREDVTAEELRDLVATQIDFSLQQRRIIDGALEVSRRTLREILRPRPEVFVLDTTQPASTALRQLSSSGHSRAPVAPGRDLDAAVGFVHLRDLLDGGDRLVADVALALPVFPETVGVLEVLHELQTRHVQMAVVIDEHGSAAGIVTVEDLVEEIVGEIYDETDRDVLTVRREPDGSLLVPGRFPAHDLPDVGIDGIPQGQYATVAGLLLDQLGRLPDAPGDHVHIGGHTFEIVAVTGRTISTVRVTARPDDARRHEADRPTG